LLVASLATCCTCSVNAAFPLFTTLADSMLSPHTRQARHTDRCFRQSSHGGRARGRISSAEVQPVDLPSYVAVGAPGSCCEYTPFLRTGKSRLWRKTFHCSGDLHSCTAPFARNPIG
jgi:hypothetical protein